MRADGSRQPPRKRASQAQRRRTYDGAIMDVATLAAFFGSTPKAVRAGVARGLLPHRRLGGRVVFIRTEIEQFIHDLPGVSREQALENLKARRGDS